MTETSVETMTPVTATGPVWRLIEWAMLACFIGMLAVMFIQVTARYALAVGVPWTDETSRFLYIGQIFLGMSIAQRYGQHIRITVALDLMGPRLRRLSETLAEIVTAVIGVALIVGAVQMMLKSGNASASTLPIRMSAIYGVQALGLALYTLLVMKDVFDRLRPPAPETRP